MFRRLASLRRVALVLAITGSLLPGIVAPLVSGGSAATGTLAARIHPSPECGGGGLPC